MPRRWIIIAGVVGGYLLLLVVINVSIRNRLHSTETEQNVVTSSQASLPLPKNEPLPAPEAAGSHLALSAEEEENYVVQRGVYTPAAWDLQMEQMLGDPAVQENIHNENLFARAGQSEAAYRKKIKWLDLRISEYEQLARRHPKDESHQQKLQNLYMLKSSLKSVEEFVAVPAEK